MDHKSKMFETRVVSSGYLVNTKEVPISTTFSSLMCDVACLNGQDTTECTASHYDHAQQICRCGELDYFPADAAGNQISINVSPDCPHSPGTAIFCLKVFASGYVSLDVHSNN